MKFKEAFYDTEPEVITEESVITFEPATAEQIKAWQEQFEAEYEKEHAEVVKM